MGPRWVVTVVLTLMVIAAVWGGVTVRGAGPGEPRLVRSPEPGWPQFRGPARDGQSAEVGLASRWPEGGPKRIWAAAGLGEGYSSPIVAGGSVVVTGDAGDALRILALDLEGRVRWVTTNGAAWKESYPGARSSVTAMGGRLYHMNAHGRLVCLEGSSGRELWNLDVLKAFGGVNLTWGLSECLLVDEKAVYVTAGGVGAGVVALDRMDGRVLWKSAVGGGGEGGSPESASYVSPILVEFGGRRLLVGCLLRTLYCVDAGTGELQWTRPYPTTYSVLAMPPALVGDGVFMTAPFGKGGKLHRLGVGPGTGAKVTVEDAWGTRLDTCQGGVVVAGSRIFGSFYPGRKGWALVDGRSGELLAEAPEYVKGSAAYADGRAYVLCEDGLVLLLELGTKGLIERGRFPLVTGGTKDAWAHPVIHSKRLYLRHQDTLFCYDIAAP